MDKREGIKNVRADRTAASLRSTGLFEWKKYIKIPLSRLSTGKHLLLLN